MYYGGFSKSVEFAGVGSAVEVGFDYDGVACKTGDFLKVLNLRVLVLPSTLRVLAPLSSLASIFGAIRQGSRIRKGSQIRRES